MSFNKFDLFIVINNFAAEGCPRLALNLIDDFKEKIENNVTNFNELNTDLMEEFKKKNP